MSSNADVNSNVAPSNPIVDIQINTDPITRRLQDLYRRIALKPDFELVEVTALVSGTLTCRKIGTTTVIPGVVPVAWSGDLLPTVGEFVWVVTPQPGAQPFAIGSPTANNPRTKVYQSTNFNLLNNVFTIFNMDTTNWSEEYDQMSGHDFVTNNSRITIARDGLYLLQASINFAANGAGIRGCTIYLNGVALAPKLTLGANAVFGDIVTVNTPKECIAGNYIEFGYYQNSGGLLGCVSGINATFLSVVRIGDLG